MSASAAAGSRRRTRKRAGMARLAGRTGFFALLAVFVVVSLAPFYWIVITSLKSNAVLAKGTTSLLPSHVTFSNYINDFTQQDFLRPLLNSVIVCLSTTVLTVIIASMAGYALSRTRIRGRPVILGFILIAGFFPILALVGPLFIAYKRSGLLNSYPALILSYMIYTLPLATWLLSSYFSQIPHELEEAAIVDGTTRIQALRKVIIPIALPGVFTAAILSFILAWNDFTFALSFMTTPNMYTAPLAIVTLGQSQYQTFYNLIDAAVVIISIPIALIVIFAQRRIVSGLTAGAIK
ncbi:MAG: carbohydrate ABC transporter permease [Streptosporangiaceae bacterium]